MQATVPVDTAQLTEIGIDVPPQAFDVPGFTDPTFDAETGPASTVTVPGGANPAPAVGAPTEPLAAADVTAADVMGTDAVTGDVLAAHPPVADQQPPAGETSTEPAERVALAAAPAIDAADEPAAAAPVFDTSDTTFGELAMADPTMDATTDTPVDHRAGAHRRPGWCGRRRRLTEPPSGPSVPASGNCVLATDAPADRSPRTIVPGRPPRWRTERWDTR